MARKHTLLVIDDEPLVVRSVQDLLRLDYRVLGATGAEQGLDLLTREPVHIVMSDQRMPGMTGVELLARARQVAPDAVRLLFTAYADSKTAIEAINLGHVFRYIPKPWDVGELESVIRQAAEQHDLLTERRRLLGELQAKNVALTQVNADLARSSELKSAFIQVASHELRTPLTILLGLSELALESRPEPPLRDWLRRMNKSATQLSRLVDQMMTVLAAGRFERPLERRAADLPQLIADAANDVRPFAELRRQDLRLQTDSVPTLAVDAPKIRASLNHLLLNAIRFTPDGGKIEVRARAAAEQGVEICISDNGQGIDAQALPHIFDPFFTTFDPQHHQSGQFEFGSRGMGLGLTVVKAFVEMHGGKVAVESRPGAGSTFTLLLPPYRE